VVSVAAAPPELDLSRFDDSDGPFGLLVQSVRDYAIFILDPSGHIRTWSPGAQRIKQYLASEIIGRHFSAFYPRDVVASGKCELELEIAARDGRFEEEGWRIRKDGSRFWASVTISAVRNAAGRLVAFAKVTRDLTIRREAEEEAQRFRLLIESVKDYAIFILDPSGHVSTWNPGAERIKQYSAAEIIGRHFSTFYPPAVTETGKCERALETAKREGRFEEEGWRIRKDGSSFWASVTLTALRDSEHGLVGFAKVTRDLTARRESEEQTRRFRLLIESVKDYAIFILDPTGRIMTWNAGARRIKQYADAEIIGQHFSIFYPADAAASGKCELELDIASREGRFEEEGWRVRKDGSTFWASVTITALRDPEGAFVGFAKVTRDLTARRQAEERQNVLAAEKAALAEKARIQEFQERFIGVLGHDLRNPLGAIQMGVGLVQQRSSDPTTLRLLERMDASAMRMSRMIEQILDLTRSRLASGFDLRAQPMDLEVTLAAIVDELRIAHPSRVIAFSCPPCPGTWDGDRLEQVFSNLIGNAIAYGAPDEPVRVEANPSGDVIAVLVHNQGPAIPTELQRRLFDPFRRGQRDSRSATTAGLGLGLYISHEIVHAHGGRLDFESTPEKGTTFRVMLPVAAPLGELGAGSSQDTEGLPP
jgi:PAS domain S-box-containing protein